MNHSTEIDDRAAETKDIERLIASDKVEGTAVFDTAANHLGRIHHLMIDRYSGQVVYAIASFGGFFGIGEYRMPLPWRALKYEPHLAGYVVDVDRSKFEKAPNFASHADPDWSDRAFNEEIEHYWFPPL
jgi:PRC-barrel domain